MPKYDPISCLNDAPLSCLNDALRLNYQTRSFESMNRYTTHLHQFVAGYEGDRKNAGRVFANCCNTNSIPPPWFRHIRNLASRCPTAASNSFRRREKLLWSWGRGAHVLRVVK